jgi:hypothetical protein
MAAPPLRAEKQSQNATLSTRTNFCRNRSRIKKNVCALPGRGSSPPQEALILFRVVDGLGLFPLTTLKQLHSQPVVENGVCKYQVEKLVEDVRNLYCAELMLMLGS